MLIDTHCHLNFEAYDEDRTAVVARAVDAGIRNIINPGIDLESSIAAIKLAGSFKGIYAAVGIHPNSTADWTEQNIIQLRQLATSHHRIVSIGEIGLDYYWDKSPTARQQLAFRAQLALAAELQLPVIIHNREASHDVLPILEEWVKSIPEALRDRPGVLHSFSAPVEYAQRAIDAGFYIGFTGPLTFKKADELRSIAATIPLNRILVETDGPFLTPHPHRGKRNEPANIPLIVDRLAALHNITSEEMGKITTDNATRLFAL